MFYHFRVHKEGRGFWAECIELDGCVTQGETLKELRSNAKEALDLFLSEPEGSKVVFPLPKSVGAESRSTLAVKPDPQVAMSVLLRYLRSKHSLTLRVVANQLGFKSINAYRKLESAKTCNPGLSTLAKLKTVFPELDLDQVLD